MSSQAEALGVQELSWTQIRSYLASHWEAGQHFSVMAPTGYGKSYLTRELLKLWTWTIVLDVKGDDDTLLEDRTHRPLSHFPTKAEIALSDETRFRIHGASMGASRSAFDDCFRKVWAAGKAKGAKGGWTIYADETRLIADKQYLGMSKHLDAIWISGRSKGITLIAGTQAPRFVPSSFYDQARYLAIGQIRDKRTLRRLAEIGGDTDLLMNVVPALDWHEFLFVGPQWMAIGKVDV